MVVKRDGRREEYSRDKLSRSIRLACVKRPLPTGALDKLIDEIEKSLQHLGRAEVSSSAIGEITIGKLGELDRVAYIRYASVYRDFEDLDQFKSEIESLQIALQETGRKPLEGQLELLPSTKGSSVVKSRKGRRPSVTPPRKKEVNTQPAMP
jgi:transcriptional repressor NrdR